MEMWNDDCHYLIDATPKGIHVINRAGILVDANRAWLIYYGVQLDDVKNRPLAEIMRDMMHIAPPASRKENDSEYLAPAALEVLKTGLPSSNTFNQDRMAAYARPVFYPKGSFLHLTLPFTANATSPPTPSDSSSPTEEKEKAAPSTPMIGKSPALERLRQMIDLVAPTAASVLLQGETGTGKDVAAREILSKSLRSKGPFIRVNCAAIPDNLIESELFGYERGAFTGALATGKSGLIEAAQGGTLFLDEIQALPLTQQSKLLQTLETKTIQRVGGVKEIPVDFRLIAATNANLWELVQRGEFRQDLFYRINVICLHLPPLRERKEDIPALVSYYLNHFCERYGKQLSLSAEAADALMEYNWPGNVRALRNLMEYLTITSTQPVVLREQVDEWLAQVRLLPDTPVYADASAMTPPPFELTEDFSLKSYMDLCERTVLERAFQKYGSSRQVAQALKMDQSSVVRKKGKYGL